MVKGPIQSLLHESQDLIATLWDVRRGNLWNASREVL